MRTWCSWYLSNSIILREQQSPWRGQASEHDGPQSPAGKQEIRWKIGIRQIKNRSGLSQNRIKIVSESAQNRLKISSKSYQNQVKLQWKICENYDKKGFRHKNKSYSKSPERDISNSNKTIIPDTESEADAGCQRQEAKWRLVFHCSSLILL